MCTGNKRASEDPSDAVFLLVENYTMTALYGLRIVWEFLKKTSLKFEHFLFIRSRPLTDDTGEEVRWLLMREVNNSESRQLAAIDHKRASGLMSVCIMDLI